MAARTRSSAKTAERTPAPALAPQPGPWDWLGDWNRQQVAVANESLQTVFRGLQAMQRLQEEAAQSTAARHAAAAEKLRKAGAPVDAAIVQGELLREDLASAARYWQDIAGAALETQTELFNCAAHLIDTENVLAPAAPRLLHS